MTDLITRPRRLRQSAALRALFEETTLSLNDLVLPIFVEEEIDDYKAIEAMPGGADACAVSYTHLTLPTIA